MGEAGTGTAAVSPGSSGAGEPLSSAAAALVVAAAAPAAPERCANCGAPLTGRYCSACGQRHLDQPVHHFWHFVSEATEDLTHADSRLWQTLTALLFRPGFLTREFLEGRRMRYLPPVRLYLVLSVLYFMIAAVLPPSGHEAVVTQKGPQITLAPFGAPGTAPMSAARAEAICANFRYDGPGANDLAGRLAADCVKVVMGNSRFRESFLHNAARAMFILLPLLALVMKMLYRKPPRHYVEHLLFFVHDHAFLFLILGIYAPLAAYAPAPLRETAHVALDIYIPVYFYLSMRRVYGQGWLLTGAKLAGLACAYLFLGSLTLAAASVYSLLTL